MLQETDSNSTSNSSVHTANLADCENGEVHGTAVTEALFDIAPEATYYIATPLTWGDLVDAVDWMIEHDIDVINMSAGWTWSGPGDGTSPYTSSPLNTVDTAVDGGIVWLNSAGNKALATWYGPFTDTDADGWHNFSDEDECDNLSLELEAGETFSAQLRWADSWVAPVPATDLDLYLSLVGQGGLIDVAMSEDDQAATLKPFEWVKFTALVSGTYCLSTKLYSGNAPAWIQLQSFTGQDIEYYTLHHSIAEPADSANAGLMAVGAAPASDTSTIEDFSSRGPTLDDRAKPDIVGADRVHSAAYRKAFPGTSQASPHVAGLAVLVKQRFPDYSPQQIANHLKNHAEERGESGADNIWGHGFARLLASDVATPEPTATAEPTSTPEPTTTPPGDICVGTAETDGAISGSWTADCESSHPDRDGSYARYYTFSITESAAVTITLESSVDSYLYLHESTGRDGTVLCENDDYGSAVTGTLCSNIDSTLAAVMDSGMVASLAEGSYTIETTTHDAATAGDFTLTVTTATTTVQPTPTPTPVTPTPVPPTPAPLPPDYKIEDHSCIADDLTDLEGYSFESEIGPQSYEDGGYTGVLGNYWNRWFNEESDAFIACSAIQYDSIQNARWRGLNYSTIIQSYGASTGILYHEQAPYVSPHIGDDLLALWLAYQFEGERGLIHGDRGQVP